MTVRNACKGKALWNDVDIPHTRSVDWDEDEDVKKFSSSSTNCAKETIDGVVDFSGTIEIYICDDDPIEDILSVGDAGTLKAFEDDDPVNFWTLPSRIEGFSVSIPIEDGEPVSATIRFTGNGVIIPPAR